MPACRLIIHADDFGLTEKVNEGIVYAHRHGILTSTSIMANGEAFEHALELCGSVPDLDLGIHLTLIEEAPVLSPEKISSLLDHKGRFFSDAFVFARRYLGGKILLKEVYAELEAQILRVRNAGLSISHLDSHQHIHILPGLFNIVIELAEKYAVSAIRLPRERPRLYMVRHGGSTRRFLQLLMLNGLCYMNSRKRVRATDAFLGFFDSGQLSKSRLSNLLKYVPKGGCCELMCHPGAPESSGAYQHWGYQHAEELGALCDGDLSDWLREQQIELTSYRQLYG